MPHWQASRTELAASAIDSQRFESRLERVAGGQLDRLTQQDRLDQAGSRSPGSTARIHFSAQVADC